MDLSKFYTDTLSGVTKGIPGALQSMTQAQRESLDMQRRAFDDFRGALSQSDGVNIPMLRFSAALGAPQRGGGLGGALASGMEAYAGALADERKSNLSRAEKLMAIQQGLANLHKQGGALPWENIDRTLGAAGRIGEIDVLRSAAQDRSVYDRMFGGGAGMGAPHASAQTPSSGPAPGMAGAQLDGLPPLPPPSLTVAQAAERAAATGQVAQVPPAQGDRLAPEALRRYMRNQEIIAAGSGSRDPRMVARVKMAQDDNEAMVPKGVFVRPDGTLDATALRIQAQAKRADSPMSATDKKAIIEADEAVSMNESAIQGLREASDLSKKSFGDPIRSRLAPVGALFGHETSTNTVNLQNLTTAQALAQLKAIFGAAPTEGERKILLDIQGSATQPDSVRQEIYRRAREAAERRLTFARQQADQLRGGTYFRPGQGPGQPPLQPRAAAPGAPADPVEVEMRRRGLLP
jgi:hypothetical protein